MLVANPTNIDPLSASERDRFRTKLNTWRLQTRLDVDCQTELFKRLRLYESLNDQNANIPHLRDDICLMRETLVNTMSGLVQANARLYATPRFPLDELMSEGSMALLRAIDKFDVERGFRFSTYATHAIRRSFFRHFEREQKRTKLGVSSEHLELMVDPNDMSTLPEREQAQRESTLNRLVDQLEARDRHIIQERFGLGLHRSSRTLQSLADELGVCRERVRQLEQRAIGKLAKMAPSEGLTS